MQQRECDSIVFQHIADSDGASLSELAELTGLSTRVLRACTTRLMRQREIRQQWLTDYRGRKNRFIFKIGETQ